MELFVELGCEELPARFVQPALESLAEGLVKLLSGVEKGAVRTWGTPRRLAVAIEGVAPVRASVEKLVTGPPAAAAFKDGVPGPAALAFARSKGVDPAALQVVDTPKGPVVAARVLQGGESTRELVAAGLEGVVTGIPFKKSMRWGADPWRFARPLHRVCCVLGGEGVDTTVMGLATVTTSVGHRLWAPEPFEVRDSAHWLVFLRERWVMADPVERRAVIRRQVELATEREGGDGPIDEALLDEVTHLVEWPTALVGSFPESLLALPPRLLVESMKVNQRYFPIHRGGRLTHRFVVIANNPKGDADLIAAGNARVLAARFHDAQFFYAEDRKKPLVEHAKKLEGMTWIRGLGTTAERQARIAVAARQIAPLFGADPEAAGQAAAVCKADLATQMVGEFPELQGHVGRLLSGLEGASEAVALAIEEHYLPRFAGDGLPRTPEGRAVAVADRLVLLDGGFRMGLQPTASADPQGLRRAALGVIQIVLATGQGGDVRALFDRAGLEVGDEVIEFVAARVRALLVGEDLPPDLVDAVVAVGGGDVVRVAARARAMGALVRSGSFGPIRATFKRVAGLAKEHPNARYVVDLFEGEPEYTLHLAVSRLPAPDAPVDAVLTALTELRPVVDAFFDKVLVMSEDAALRTNRLGLLRAIVERFAGFADFSRLSTE